MFRYQRRPVAVVAAETVALPIDFAASFGLAGLAIAVDLVRRPN